MHAEAEALGQPVDEALFLGRPDLDRTIGVGRVERVRRAPPAARTSSACRRARSSRRARTSRRRARRPASPRRQRRHERGAAHRGARIRRRRRRGEQALPGCGSASHGSNASRSAAFCARRSATRAASAGSCASAASTCRGALGRQLAVDVRVEVGVGRAEADSSAISRVHLTTLQRRDGVRRPCARRSFSRARDSRDITVPTGIDSSRRDLLVAHLLDRREQQHLALLGRQPADLRTTSSSSTRSCWSARTGNLPRRAAVASASSDTLLRVAPGERQLVDEDVVHDGEQPRAKIGAGRATAAASPRRAPACPARGRRRASRRRSARARSGAAAESRPRGPDAAVQGRRPSEKVRRRTGESSPAPRADGTPDAAAKGGIGVTASPHARRC